jgi:hypothetical protein
MMRYLCGAVLALAFMAPMPIDAAVFSKDPNASRATTKLGGGPPIVTVRHNNEGTASLTGSTPTVFTWGSRIWSTTSNSAGTSLYTGVPLISDVIIGSFCNADKVAAMDCTAGESGKAIGQFYGLPGYLATGGTVPNPVGPGSLTGLVGYGGAHGEAKVVAAMGLGFTLDLAQLGAGNDLTATLAVGTVATIKVTFGPLHTDDVTITAITSNVISLPNRSPPSTSVVGFTADPTTQEEVKTYLNTTWTTVGGAHPLMTFVTTWKAWTFAQSTAVQTSGGVITSAMGTHGDPNAAPPQAILKVAHTVTVTGGGPDPTTLVSGTGKLTVITPYRVDTGDALTNSVPGYLRLKYSFVPEPGTAFLLVVGAAGLAVIGRRKLGRK